MPPTRRRKLSGGEKARLLLGLATFAGPHLLILDEPTNHLDIDSRAALIEAINDYPGAVILVSHDRYLLEACADRLWLVADGKVTPFDGDLDDYRRLVLSDRDDRTATARPKARQPRRRAPRGGAVAGRARAAAPADRRRGSDGRAAQPRDRAYRRGAGRRRAVRARSRQGRPLAKARANAANALAKARGGLARRGAALEAAMRSTRRVRGDRNHAPRSRRSIR